MEDLPTPLQNPSEIKTGQDVNVVPGKPFKFKRALKKIGVIILIIIISIAGYQLKGPLGRLFTKNPETEKVAIQPTPTVITPTPNQENSINFYKIERLKRHLNLLNEQRGFLNRAVFEITISGIFMEGWENITENDFLRFVYNIKIRNDSSGELIFRFTEDQIRGSSVTLLSPEGPSFIRLTDLQPGDIVTIRETVDLLDNTQDSRVKVEVERP